MFLSYSGPETVTIDLDLDVTYVTSIQNWGFGSGFFILFIYFYIPICDHFKAHSVLVMAVEVGMLTMQTQLMILRKLV